MMDVGRHPNITLLTLSEVKELTGEPGNFKVKVLQHARYVDMDKCTACDDCTAVCPVDTDNEFELGLSKRKAIYKLFPQAVPSTFSISRIGHPPCRVACPAGVNAQGYIALIRVGKYKEALELERSANPFASVCGRVCNHPCESDCARSDVDEPVAIASLKRFCADFGSYPLEQKKPSGEKIAVIGGGPGGLSCAYFLAKANYQVTVFEAEETVGGLLSWGIPQFRLPRKSLDADIEYIKSFGVEIKTKTKIGETISLDDVRKNHRAVFIATGAHDEIKLNVEGENLDGVLPCVSFLKTVNLGGTVSLGKKVVVIGGGNAAIDAARTAQRLGSDVTILYRRSRREMPANSWEVSAAEEEGVKIEFLVAPKMIIGDTNVSGIECVRMKLGDPDASGRRRPIPIEGSEFTIPVDNVIVAISQKPAIDWLGEEYERTKWGTLVTDPDTLETTVKGIYAGGDVCSGPSTVIEAVAAGKKAAETIDAAIRGVEIERIEWKKVRPEPDELAREPKAPRTDIPKLNTEKRKGNAEVEIGYNEEQAKRESERCLNCAICSDCRECEKACQPKAIDFSMKDTISELNVGAVIVASGIDYYDPTEASEFGYRRFMNVVTSFELERLLSAGGPTKGELVRLTDNKPPKRVAFINCVGSRNMARDIPYCSRICCMNAIKDSLIVKEFFPDAEVYIFYIDIRAFGKGFEELYNRSLEEGVKYVKGKPSKVVEDPKTGNLILAHENQETGKIEHMQVDMVVLSSAIIPAEGANDLATIVGIETEMDGFFKQKDACGYPLESSRDGVFLCGCATGPKDITDSIAEASGAAAKAALFVDERVPEVKSEVTPRDVSGEPRVGVFVCHCGLNIAGLLPCESLAEYAKTMQNVVFAEDVLFACAESTQRQIQERVQEHNLNRVVIASCTPKTHEPIFQETLAKVGLNPYLFEMVNIRDQCSWVHQKEPEAATDKAKDLIRMAVARVRLLKPLDKRELEVNQDILAIGGGIAGMQTAIDFASRGFTVHLVEKEAQLGGRVRNLASLYPQDESGKELIERKLDELKKFSVNVHTSSAIENIDGFVGNFDVTLQSKEKKETEKLKVGAIVLAIGSDLFPPVERHGYKKFANVKTNMELEELVGQNKLLDVKSVAFIQCVGSRGPEGNPGCSRYCCQAAIKQAIKLREKGIDVTIFHRGIRVYSKGAEMMYRKARELGVLFLPYSDDGYPELIGTDKVEQIEVYSKDLDTDVVVPVDMVILSLGMIPKTEEAQRLSEMLRVSRGPDKFFLERHPKFGPVETSVDGVYLCGCCQFPQDIADSIAQASAVTSRALALLSRGLIRLEPVVSSVDDVLCRGCGHCAEICEFKAIELIEKTKGIWVARVNEALCKGCGSCCAVCPTGAIDIRHFQRGQIEAELEALFD